MAYRELIKDFNGIRSMLRDQYVYGFHGRENCRAMSKRSYDDDARRIRNWLEAYTAAYYTKDGKKVYLLIDSRREAANPLYRVFRAKSFTDLDIMLHFCLLDMLKVRPMTAAECTEAFCETYLEDERFPFPDEGSVRNKLKEYEALGILVSGKQGKKLYYSLSPAHVDLEPWQDAIALFSESAPLGVIGSFFSREQPSVFRFKHRYMLSALDSEVLLSLFLCMRQNRLAEMTVISRSGKKRRVVQCPVRIYISTQTGRQYLLGLRPQDGRMSYTRLDRIHLVRPGALVEKPEEIQARWVSFSRCQWGVSTGREKAEKVTMILHAAPWEGHIVQRLEREKRIGTVTRIDDTHWQYEAEVLDPEEMLHWVRTFIGRIDAFDCTDPDVVKRYREDLVHMAALYGGDGDAL